MIPDLSLAVLCYNEEATVEQAARLCSNALENCGWSYELVLVDDGSTDQSRAIIERLAEELPHCRAMFHPRNLGIGAGIRTCYFGTKGRWATLFPADLQVDVDELPRLLALLSDCDVLVTYRDPAKRQVTRLRKLVSAADRTLVRLMYGLSLRDLHWVHFFRRDLLDRMTLTCWSPTADTEMFLFSRKLGARIQEVPLDDLPRTQGVAKGAAPRNVIWALSDLVALRFRRLKLAPEGQVGTVAACRDQTRIEA